MKREQIRASRIHQIAPCLILRYLIHTITHIRHPCRQKYKFDQKVASLPYLFRAGILPPLLLASIVYVLAVILTMGIIRSAITRFVIVKL